MRTSLLSKKLILKFNLLFIFTVALILFTSAKVYANNPVDVNGQPLKFNTEYYIRNVQTDRMLSHTTYLGWDYMRAQDRGVTGTPVVLLPAQSSNDNTTREILFNENVFIRNTDSNWTNYVYWSRSNTRAGGIHLNENRRASLFQLQKDGGTNNNINNFEHPVFVKADRWVYADNRSSLQSFTSFEFIPVNAFAWDTSTNDNYTEFLDDDGNVELISHPDADYMDEK